MFALFIDGEWVPIIGDPTFTGWLTVVAYFITAGLCFRAAAASKSIEGRGTARVFWIALVAMLVALGVNKQLDLQTWFTVLAKKLATAQGWYEFRRPLQGVFIAVIAVGALAISAWMFRLRRNRLQSCGLALVGASFLLGFVVIRAASFHHVDQILGIQFAGLKVNAVLELSGIICIAVSALRHGRRRSDASGLNGPNGKNQFVLVRTAESPFTRRV